jgi:hypothetical protein
VFDGRGSAARVGDQRPPHCLCRHSGTWAASHSLSGCPHGEARFWVTSHSVKEVCWRVLCGVYDTVVYRGSWSRNTVVLQLAGVTQLG